MAYSEYWNPKNETLPREELQALQLLKLRRMCEWAYANAPFHRRKFDEASFHPEQLKTLDDIRRIPFMTREEWMERSEEHTSELQSQSNLVCRLLLEKKKITRSRASYELDLTA